MILIFCFNNLSEVLKKFFGAIGVMISINNDRYLKSSKMEPDWTVHQFLTKQPKISWPYGEGNIHSVICTSKSIN